MDEPVISKTISRAVEVKAGVDIQMPEMSEVMDVVPVDAKTLPAAVKDFKKQAKQNLEDDYTYARENLRKLLEKGMSAVEGAIQLAKESESPRVYESTSAFIKTLAEINKDLLSIAETINKSSGPDTPAAGAPQTAGTINNNTIITVSSEDLSDMVMVQRRLASVNTIDVKHTIPEEPPSTPRH